MCGSSHIRSVQIGVKYRNCGQNLDVYLRFAIWMGQNQSKWLHELITNGLVGLKVTSL